VVQGLPTFDDPNLLIGAEHFSDAGVYRLADGLAIVQSVDFFPPLVDDPFTFGRIAAANALGDIYATGGRPRTALNIVGFPDDKLDLDVLHRILAGGSERVRAAGAVVVGGHSVRDAEVKYGLSVTGVVDPDRMMSNRGAAPGDALVLTKGLGTGFVTTAARAKRCPDDALEAACASMVMLNRAAAEAATGLGVRGATDVTGFGLAGHALELARASEVTVELDLPRLPLLPGAEPLITRKNHTRANATNRGFTESSSRIEAGADDPRLEVIYDPQTSGGLLVAVEPGRADELVASCRAGGMEQAGVVGRVSERGDAQLVIR
jgi:selenide,water dikinase